MCGVIVLDVGRSRSTWHGRDAYIHNHCLDILITMHFSINCSAVICSPTVIHAFSREATSETYGPRVSFPLYCISFPYCWILFTIFQSLLSNLYNKNTKNIYFIISIISHFCEWPWKDWQPLYHVGCEVLDCLCRYSMTCASSPTRLIPWFSKLRKILTLLCYITLSSSREKPTQAQEVAACALLY